MLFYRYWVREILGYETPLATRVTEVGLARQSWSRVRIQVSLTAFLRVSVKQDFIQLSFRIFYILKLFSKSTPSFFKIFKI